jgi:hypothetical protein
MKRLVWLFLALFCAAFAQVRPVEPLLPKAKDADCCPCTDPCSMPDCAMLPAAHQPTVFERANGELNRETRRGLAKLPSVASKFYLSALESDVAAPTLRAPAQAAHAASPPLFRVHCSYLI